MPDATKDAGYVYDCALMDYEEALASRDSEKIAAAESALAKAARDLSREQSERVAARTGHHQPLTFTALLNDPTQQLDPHGEVMASIRDYQNATKATIDPADTRVLPPGGLDA